MMNQLNALVSFGKLAESFLEQIANELGIDSLELYTDSLAQPTYPCMWLWEMSSEADETQNEGCTLIQLSLKYNNYQQWDARRVRQMFLNKLGFNHSAVYMRAFFNVFNELADNPAERVGKMRVEPVGGQLWQQVPEPDSSLIHDRLRLKIYYD